MRMTCRQWDFIFKVGTVCRQLASSQISFGNYLLQFALHRKEIRILFLFGSGQTFPFRHAHIQTKMHTPTHLPTWVSLSFQTCQALLKSQQAFMIWWINRRLIGWKRLSLMGKWLQVPCCRESTPENTADEWLQQILPEVKS